MEKDGVCVSKWLPGPVGASTTVENGSEHISNVEIIINIYSGIHKNVICSSELTKHVADCLNISNFLVLFINTENKG